MDAIAQKLAACTSPDADQDPTAFSEIAERVARVGRAKTELIAYSKLVEGITLRFRAVS